MISELLDVLCNNVSMSATSALLMCVTRCKWSATIINNLHPFSINPLHVTRHWPVVGCCKQHSLLQLVGLLVT